MRRFFSYSACLLLGTSIVTPVLAQDDAEDWQVPVTVGKDGWMRYVNGRFGCAIPVPPGMVATRPPDNGGGQGFNTPDGKVRIAVWGSFNVDGLGDVEARWAQELADKGQTITYKHKTKGWFVISGVTKDGTGFYMRYAADAKYCAGWEIAYPQVEEKRYVPWVERIAKGFEAGLGRGDDKLE
jgi:hypothetical protein